MKELTRSGIIIRQVTGVSVQALDVTRVPIANLTSLKLVRRFLIAGGRGEKAKKNPFCVHFP